MGTYTVTGADRETGQPATLKIEAASLEDAQKQAWERNILVERVDPDQRPAPPAPPPSRPPPPPPEPMRIILPARRSTVRAAEIAVGVALGHVIGFFAIGFCILVMSAVGEQSRQEQLRDAARAMAAQVGVEEPPVDGGRTPRADRRSIPIIGPGPEPSNRLVPSPPDQIRQVPGVRFFDPWLESYDRVDGRLIRWGVSLENRGDAARELAVKPYLYYDGRQVWAGQTLRFKADGSAAGEQRIEIIEPGAVDVHRPDWLQLRLVAWELVR